MKKRMVSAMTLMLLLTSTLMLAFHVQLVRAVGTIYIRADGSIDPPTAPISSVDNVTYVLTGNIIITYDADGIVIERNNTIVDGAGYTVQGTGAYSYSGLFFTKGSNLTIRNTNVKRFFCGILLEGSSNDSIVGNNITNNDNGIWLDSFNIYGDYIGSSSSNSIVENNITNNDFGIYLDSSSNNSISGNNITNNHNGVYLSESSNNVFRGNSMADNRYSFGVFGDSLSGFVNDVDVSNTVDGKPVYYWVEKSYEAVPPDAGYIALVNCTDITIQGLTLADNTQGILVAYTQNSTIKNNSITNTYSSGIYFYASSNNSIIGNNITNNSYIGIWLGGSSNYNSIVGNNITNNSDDGIDLSESSDYNSIVGNNITNNSVIGIDLDGSSNTVSRNNITNNYEGIDLYYSNYDSISENNITNNSQYGIDLYASSNTSITRNNIRNNNYGIYLLSCSSDRIVGNNITNNSRGIWVDWSSNIRFWHNNFIDNTQQVRVETSIYANVWDDGYSSGGNYWSDYSGTDANHDGTGDTPYVIDANNIDYYPLMVHWSPIRVIGVGFSLADTFHFNITVKNFGETAVDISKITVAFINGTVLEIPYYGTIPALPYRLSLNQTVTLNCTWDWTSYEGKNATIKVFTSEDYPAEVTLTLPEVIPEFPSFLILPLFLIATLLAVTIYRRKHRQTD